jgi:aminopeptidase N
MNQLPLVFINILSGMFQKALIYVFFLLLFVNGFAQNKIFQDNIAEIAEQERKHFYTRQPGGETRTGGEIDITYVRFFWEINPEVLYIKGSVHIHFKSLVEDLSAISLELNDNMVIDSILFRNEQMPHTYYSDFQFQISLSDNLENGAMDSVEIFYQGIPEEGSGFGSFVRGQHDGVPVIWTLSEPYGAKEWWPGKNDLADKIDSIDVVVKTPEQYRAASHGVLVSEIVEGGNKTCHWKHRYPIVSYLVAVAVTNYVEFTQYAFVGGDSIPIVNYVYPEDSAQAASDSQNTAEMIALFDSLFGPYPFAAEKYGHAQWSRGGGMEHQTMSFMQGFGHDLRAHELAHSWFGNKVTLGTWHDIFLNEGFATYATGLSFEVMYDGFYWDIWKGNTRLAASDGADGSVYVGDTTDVERIFSPRLSYNKGAYLLHMLRWVLGDDRFFTAVRNYVNDPMLSYRFATISDLVWHFENVYESDLNWFFDDWYYGEGYPTYGINIAQMENSGSIHITIYQQQSNPSVEYFEMPVPVAVYGSGQEKTLVCNNTHSGEAFVFDDPGFVMDSARFDPDQWLLARLDFMNPGVEEIDEVSLVILPNPAKNSVRLSIPDNRIGEVSINDFKGSVVLEKDFHCSDETVELDISSLRNGLYLVTIKSGHTEYRGKFVKK